MQSVPGEASCPCGDAFRQHGKNERRVLLQLLSHPKDGSPVSSALGRSEGWADKVVFDDGEGGARVGDDQTIWTMRRIFSPKGAIFASRRETSHDWILGTSTLRAWKI